MALPVQLDAVEVVALRHLADHLEPVGPHGLVGVIVARGEPGGRAVPEGELGVVALELRDIGGVAVLVVHAEAEPDAEAALPRPTNDSKTMVLVCGTDGFVSTWGGPIGRAPPGPDGKKGAKVQGPLRGLLAEAGFDESEVFKY